MRISGGVFAFQRADRRVFGGDDGGEAGFDSLADQFGRSAGNHRGHASEQDRGHARDAARLPGRWRSKMWYLLGRDALAILRRRRRD